MKKLCSLLILSAFLVAASPAFAKSTHGKDG